MPDLMVVVLRELSDVRSDVWELKMLPCSGAIIPNVTFDLENAQHMLLSAVAGLVEAKTPVMIDMPSASGC